MLFRKPLLVIIATIVATIALIGGVIVANTVIQPTDKAVTPIPNKTIQEVDISLANPLTLEIPKLKIKAPIEHVGMLENKQMDVPKVYANVAWYKLGYRVGDRGNAVISGHVDTPMGTPAIFTALSTLQPNDIVIVWEGSKFVIFKVYAVESYPVGAFPIEKVFGKSNDVNLNLITCDGNLVNGQYQDRLVVFTKKI